MPGTLVTGDVINTARDAHPSFDKLRHPDPLLIRALSRYQRELLARIIRLDPSMGVAQLDTALPLADFAAGIPLPAYKYPVGAEVTHAPPRSKTHSIDLVPWREKANYRHATYILDGVLFFTGRSQEWSHYSNIRFFYVPEPSAIVLAADTVLDLLPDAAEPCLVSYLALVMATRGGASEGTEKPNPLSFRVDWKGCEDRFFDEIGRHTQATSSIIQDNF